MDEGPIFTALATSTRRLYLLLRCIAFTSRAEVTVTDEGLRFTVEESHAIQASTILYSGLFSSYSLRLPEDQPSVPPFSINIIALLETLQIFGISESSSTYKNQNGGIASSYATAFNTPALGLGGTCRISYPQVGAPLLITLEEAGVKTTCEMNTYRTSNHYDEESEIPLDLNAIALRIIMPSTWLHDAIAELSGTNPEVLVVNASSVSAPYFALEGQGGPFGDSTVDFMPDSKPDTGSSIQRSKKQPQVTETFHVNASSNHHGRLKQNYKFEFIKRAGRAMALASKVSIRQDQQGVLNLQFMVETTESGMGGPGPGVASGGSSFIDFRFVPLVDDGEDEYEDEDAADASTQSE